MGSNTNCITRVDLSNNQLIRVNPKFFTDFKNLEHFRCNNNFIKAFPHEMVIAEKLKTVECFDNEDELYDNIVFQELWDKGIIVSGDESAILAENQDENTAFEKVNEILDKNEKDKELEAEEQYRREKEKQARAFRVFQKSEMRKEQERVAKAKARGTRKDMERNPNKLKNDNKTKQKMSFLYKRSFNKMKAAGG